jgi:hypothetical protein
MRAKRENRYNKSDGKKGLPMRNEAMRLMRPNEELLGAELITRVKGLQSYYSLKQTKYDQPYSIARGGDLQQFSVLVISS